MSRPTSVIPPDVEYHRVLAGEKRGVGRGIFAIVLLIGGMLFFNIVFAAGAAIVDSAVGTVGRATYTPLMHAAGLASVAVLIPWSMLIQRWLYAVKGSVLFAVVHLSTDLLLNVHYLIFAIGTALITWRTGGIEIAVVLHAGLNTLGFIFDAALHVDVAAAYDRSAGVGSVTTLLPPLVIVIASVVVWVRTRRTGPARTPTDAPSVGVTADEKAVMT